MISVYTTKNCVACRYTKKFLRAHGIVYTEIDASNPEVAEELRAKGFRELPVVITEHSSWSGYNRERLKGLAHGWPHV